VKRSLFALALTAAVLNAGCFEMFQQSSAAPATVNMLGGTWTSTTTNASSLTSSCTGFQWNVTEKTSTTGAGWFQATCFGVLQVVGSAKGTMSGSSVTWIASAVANGGGVSNCAINLQGTASLGTDSINIPYTGTTCMGPVSGTESLKRN
jgi:hypothetical protein